MMQGVVHDNKSTASVTTVIKSVLDGVKVRTHVLLLVSQTLD